MVKIWFLMGSPASLIKLKLTSRQEAQRPWDRWGTWAHRFVGRIAIRASINHVATAVHVRRRVPIFICKRFRPWGFICIDWTINLAHFSAAPSAQSRRQCAASLLHLNLTMAKCDLQRTLIAIANRTIALSFYRFYFHHKNICFLCSLLFWGANK